MSTDIEGIIDGLRGIAENFGTSEIDAAFFHEAANLIASLQEALRPFAAKVAEIEEIARDVDAEPDDIGVGVSYAECLAARAILLNGET